MGKLGAGGGCGCPPPDWMLLLWTQIGSAVYPTPSVAVLDSPLLNWTIQTDPEPPEPSAAAPGGEEVRNRDGGMDGWREEVRNREGGMEGMSDGGKSDGGVEVRNRERGMK